jgi:chromosomal replication initiator protein
MKQLNMKNPELISNASFDPLKTFQTFFVGDFNRIAYELALNICDLTETSISPLVLIGNIGLGKTHLVNAIARQIKHKNPEKLILYFNVAELLSQFIKANVKNHKNELLTKAKYFEVLLVDDFQYFIDKEVSQDLFSDLINHYSQYKKRVEVASSIAITQSNGFCPRLTSRMNGGIMAFIEKPNFESRLRIIEKMAIIEKCPEQILQFIAEKNELDIRQMQGFLLTLISRSEILKKEIDLDYGIGNVFPI